MPFIQVSCVSHQDAMNGHLQARDLVLMILKRMVVEMKLLAVYHKSLLFKHHGAEIKYDYKTCYRDGLVY